MAASVVAAFVPVLCFAPLTAHAELGQSYPGGCMVVVAALKPNNCVYNNIAGDPETLVYAGVGTVTVTSACSGSFTTSVSGTYTLFGETGGCDYTMTLTGSGVASTFDPNLDGIGNCQGADAGDNAISCPYVAAITAGTAVGEAVTTSFVSISLDVLNQNGIVICHATASGVGSVTALCGPYGEAQDELYTARLTVTSGSPDAIAVAAQG